MREPTIAAVALVALCAACSSDPTVRDEPQPVGSTGGAGGAGGSATVGTGGQPPNHAAALDGEVATIAGVPLADAVLGLCDEDSCRSARSETDGTFAYSSVPPNHYKLDVRADPSGPGTFTALSFPLDLADDQVLTLPAPLLLPETGNGTVLTGGVQAVAIDAELTITIDDGQIEVPFGVMTPFLAGVRVAPEHWPPNTMPAGRVLAVWAFNPYAMLSNVPAVPLLTADFGLASGTPVAFYQIEHLWGEVELAANGAVSSDGLRLEATPGEGLSEMTWLVVVTP